MGNEENWNTFARTGRVSDYLAYVGDGRQHDGNAGWENSRKEERGRRDRASDGNGAFSSNHW